MRDNTPVLPGFIERCTEGVAGPPAMLLHVWCRWCCCFHQHGLADLQTGDTTHRVAHCYARDSEYDDSGYSIHVTDIPYSTARKRVRSATAAQRAAIRAGRISEAVQRLRDQAPPAA